MKKKWEKPFIQVIIRSRPEEGILATCKEMGLNGPNVTVTQCRIAGCDLCDEPSDS